MAHAIFLASAGLNRLGLSDKITYLMSMDEMLPAVAQGAIGIQINERDDAVRKILAPLNHAATEIAVTCERGFMAALDGSCRTPIAGHATIENGIVNFRGEALTPSRTAHGSLGASVARSFSRFQTNVCPLR